MVTHLDLVNNISFSALILRSVAGQTICRTQGWWDCVSQGQWQLLLIIKPVCLWQGIQNSFVPTDDQGHAQSRDDGANISQLFLLYNLPPCAQTTMVDALKPPLPFVLFPRHPAAFCIPDTSLPSVLQTGAPKGQTKLFCVSIDGYI